jgi:hypothetical protein
VRQEEAVHELRYLLGCRATIKVRQQRQSG